MIFRKIFTILNRLAWNALQSTVNWNKIKTSDGAESGEYDENSNNSFNLAITIRFFTDDKTLYPIKEVCVVCSSNNLAVSQFINSWVPEIWSHNFTCWCQILHANMVNAFINMPAIIANLASFNYLSARIIHIRDFMYYFRYFMKQPLRTSSSIDRKW